jgi:hypothetical protein
VVGENVTTQESRCVNFAKNLKLFACFGVLPIFSQNASLSPNSPLIYPIYKKLYLKYGITSELDFPWFIWSSFVCSLNLIGIQIQTPFLKS